MKELIESLITWWRRNNRNSLPWRSERDPYRLLVALVLLRCTNATRVARFYSKFFERFPRPSDLASADVEEIRAFISPLGLHHRAPTLKMIGELLSKRLPTSPEELMKVPGIGRYTAHAFFVLLSNRGELPVDRTIARVISRLYGLKSVNVSTAWYLAQKLRRHAESVRDLFLALLDLAALVCKPRKPKCSMCPIAFWCVSRGRAEG